MVEVTGEHICFYVDSGAGFVSGKEGILHGVGDDGEPEVLFMNVVDGEADAVYGDASFGDDVLHELFGDFDVNVGGVGEFIYFGDFSDGVDVSLYDMSFEAVAELHGGFHVNFATEVFDGDGFLGFGREFDGECAGGFFDDGEAGAVDGDGVSDAGFIAAFEC